MNPAQILFFVSNFTIASTLATISWLYIDALLFRFEIKSFLRLIGFSLLTIVFALNFATLFYSANQTLIFWIQSISFWFLFISFIFDSHSKLQILTIAGIIATVFLNKHALLSLQSFLIAISILQLAYFTKHKDMIPLTLGFFLISIAEFFNYLDKFKGFENLSLAGSLLYVFVAIALFYWLWSYLVIRFTLKRKS